MSTAIGPAAAQQTAPNRVAVYEKAGPYRVTVIRKALCCDRKGKDIDVYLPVMTNKPGTIPVVTWGNGTLASPQKYDYLLKHVASFGIAVVATRDASVARGETMRDAITLLRREPRFASLDLKRVAAMGHSQGAGGAINAAITAKGGIRTVIAIGLPARRHCRTGDCNNIPFGLPPGSSILFISGRNDPLSPPEEIRNYFEAVPAGVTKARAVVRNANHNDIQGQPGCRFLNIGCRHGVDGFVPSITAWLVWQLGIDPTAKQIFAGASAPFLTDEKLSAAEFKAR